MTQRVLEIRTNKEGDWIEIVELRKDGEDVLAQGHSLNKNDVVEILKSFGAIVRRDENYDFSQD